MATFRQIQSIVLDDLARLRWSVARSLKVPHATDPDERVRLWFRPQSIHYAIDNEGRGAFDAAGARSLWIDMKQLDATARTQGIPHGTVLAGFVSRSLVRSGELDRPLELKAIGLAEAIEEAIR